MTKLTATKRDIFGKKVVDARAEGKMPIVIYGTKEKSAPYFVDTKDFLKVLNEAGESTVVTLHTEAGDKDTLIHDVSYHPLTGAPIHADFLVIEANKPIQVGVPLEFDGIAPAVKDLGGALVKVMHEVEVEALPKNLPHEIIVDISALTTFESQILARDLKLPNGVTLITEPEEVIAAVSQAGEEVKAEEAAPSIADIEISEERGKKEEEAPAE